MERVFSTEYGRQRKELCVAKTHSFVILGVFRDHISQQTDPIVDAGAILLLDQVVNLLFVRLEPVTTLPSLLVKAVEGGEVSHGDGGLRRAEGGGGRGRGGHGSQLWFNRLTLWIKTTAQRSLKLIAQYYYIIICLGLAIVIPASINRYVILCVQLFIYKSMLQCTRSYNYVHEHYFTFSK